MLTVQKISSQEQLNNNPEKLAQKNHFRKQFKEMIEMYFNAPYTQLILIPISQSKTKINSIEKSQLQPQI